MTDASSPTPFQRLWLSETIRLREEHAGPLEDAEANRLARAEQVDLAERIQHRAVHLARRDGQWQALLHWLQGARLAGLLLALLALLSGFGLALAALGDGRQPVNVFWALGSLLGLNLLMLFGWLLGLLLTRDHPGALGRLWLWLGEKLGRGKTLAQALGEMTMVAEGVTTAKSGLQLGRKLGLSLPIIEEIYACLYENKPAKTALQDLMSRPAAGEMSRVEELLGKGLA